MQNSVPAVVSINLSSQPQYFPLVQYSKAIAMDSDGFSNG